MLVLPLYGPILCTVFTDLCQRCIRHPKTECCVQLHIRMTTIHYSNYLAQKILANQKVLSYSFKIPIYTVQICKLIIQIHITKLTGF